ncbi:MAG: chemotaxis protein CheA [Candidatus Krumholzibacteriota bacterium]|nr:chemotaxis protein CheA [Candidatus Krumholzibacteriota bacterium]
MKASDYKALFVSEANEILRALEEGMMDLEKGDNNTACLEELFRNAHNMKGMSGAMGYDQVVEASHALENILDYWKKGELTIDSSEIDLLLRVVDMLGKLVHWAMNEEEGIEGEQMLGDILVLLSPINMKLGKNDPDSLEKIENVISERGLEKTVETDHGVELPGIADPPEFRTCDINDSPHQQAIVSTRVDLERLDNLMDLVGELIISRIRLSSIAQETGAKELLAELESSGKLISEIQKDVMEARLVPAEQIFHRFKRMARDTSRELGKKVKFEVKGSDIGLDRTVLERMGEPLVHLIRNAIDHGIESPEERIAMGKPETGNLILSAKREKNHVIVEVEDDGRGIDIETVRKKSGKETIEELKGDEIGDELCGILTAPGFSTRDRVSRYSGRGVGMNVVKDTIDSLGGSMNIASRKSGGTLISMHLPINLSIIKALLFRVGAEIHALPIEYVKETTRVEHSSFKTIRGKQVYLNGDETVPVIRPDEIFEMRLDQNASRFIKMIIIDAGEESAGLIVDHIIGQQDVVIKGLPVMVRGISGISGATILGSGMIAFIWDPRVIFQGRCTNESDKETVLLEN